MKLTLLASLLESTSIKGAKYAKNGMSYSAFKSFTGMIEKASPAQLKDLTQTIQDTLEVSAERAKEKGLKRDKLTAMVAGHKLWLIQKHLNS
jgi:hypothetical protein